MDGNVQKINLDELKKAREALNNELGISNPEPPKKSKAEKEVSKASEESTQVEEKIEEPNQSLSEVENVIDEEEANKDLSAYDNFSQFEINSELEVPSIILKKEQEEYNDIDEITDDIDDEENELENNDNSDIDDFINMLEESLGDDLLEEFPEYEEEEEPEEEEVIDPELEKMLLGNPDDIDIDKLLDGIGGLDVEDEYQGLEETVEEPVAIENEVDEKPVKIKKPEQKPVSAPKSVQQKPVAKPSPVAQKTATTSNAVKTVSSVKENAIPLDVSGSTEPQPMPFRFNSIERNQEPVQQKPIQDEPRIQFNVDKGSVNGKKEEVFDASKYLPKIADKKFIDIIRSKSFMGTDNFTCIYGIQEDENVFCQNFKDFYNTIVFSENDNDENIFNLFSSIIMSLLLKNSKYDINFAICDAKSGGPFTVYNDLSYMFIDKVAETNRDIIQSLKSISKEIDSRYEALAKANAKSIEKFNDEMRKAHIAPLPYIILFFNNYTRASHLDDSGEIDTTLSYILRFGRLVGVNVCLVSYDENLVDNVNFNLQTRIAFKTELQETSISQIGENGAEDIGYNDEYVVKTLYSDKLIHLKPTKITQKEIELLIKNIEK